MTKISELIELLEEYKAEYGDINVDGGEGYDGGLSLFKTVEDADGNVVKTDYIKGFSV